MYTLLVIDMQPQFRTSEKCLPEVLHLISKAKEDKANVLVVEYVGDGLSWPAIRKELKDYKRKKTIKKNGDDGGYEIYFTLKEKNWLNKPIVTCGVNADCCVRDTMNGLSNAFDDGIEDKEITKKPKVFVVQKACNWSMSQYDINDAFWGYPEEVKMIKDKNLFSNFDLKSKIFKTKK